MTNKEIILKGLNSKYKVKIPELNQVQKQQKLNEFKNVRINHK